MLQRLENYIKNLMEALATEYPTVKFYAWDVVNEAVDPNTSDGMRTPGSNNKNPGSSLWMQTVGRDFIVKALNMQENMLLRIVNSSTMTIMNMKTENVILLLKFLPNLKPKAWLTVWVCNPLGYGLSKHKHV